MPALTAGLGRPPNLPEVERVMPAKAQNNPRDTPRKSNGTTRAGRCTDASPARQARTTRLNNPSSTGAKQYLVGSTDLPCWFSAHVYVGWAALSFNPAGRTVTRSQLLFAPDTWSTLSWRQRSHCVQHTPWLVSSAMPLVSSTVAVIAREAALQVHL